jgi:serine/threonine-protein kinase
MNEAFIGSLPYSSPEQMQGRKILDERSDIYSFGLLMFEMLTGKHPCHTTSHCFSSWCKLHCIQAPPTFEEINPYLQIPQELQQLVMGCLAKDVNDRPHNMSEVLEVLAKIKTQIQENAIDNSRELQLDPNVKLVPLITIPEKECCQKQWTNNKPLASICFSHLLYTGKGNIATL